MMRFALIPALALVAACQTAPALPAGLTGADVATFRQALEVNGCVVNTPQAGARIEAATGYDEAKLGALTDHLANTGELREVPGGIRLITGACADA